MSPRPNEAGNRARFETGFVTLRESVPTETIRPFNSLESALEFMVLLEDVIGEVSLELQSLREAPAGDRCRMGLDLAIYKIQQLSVNVKSSRRILNDLLTIRRVLAAQPVTPANSQSSFIVSEVVTSSPAH